MQIPDLWDKKLPARNAWQHLPGTYLSELLASSGVDVVTLDLQHGMIDLDSARDSILAIEARGAAPFARVPGVDVAQIGSLLDAGNFVRTLERRQGLQTGCLDEIAFALGWISADQLSERADMFAKNEYGVYLKGILR